MASALHQMPEEETEDDSVGGGVLRRSGFPLLRWGVRMDVFDLVNVLKIFVINVVMDHKIVTAIVVILVWFLFFAVVPFLRSSWRLQQRYEKFIKTLEGIKEDAGGVLVDLDRIASQAMGAEGLSHAWQEYRQTLYHQETKVNEQGQEQVVRWRATAMAEVFFAEQALVDTPLKLEFVKHLPGIFTGIGIIGTFSGLIGGLQQFDSAPEKVHASLDTLIRGVSEAFWVSAIAICLAILFTGIEKSVVTAGYRRVEKICQLINSFFSAGIGAAEYLSRVATFSERSSTQASQIKDALVSDLKLILSEISNQQVHASAQQTQQMSADLAKAVTDTLQEPIKLISQAVNQVAGNQGDAVNSMLKDVLSDFSARMEKTFGGQLSGMNALLEQTMKSMQFTVGRFDQLATNLQNAGQGAGEAMVEPLLKAIASMESRQQAMTLSMSDFVGQMKEIARSSQTESAQKMQSVLGELGDKVGQIVASLSEQAKESSGTQNDSLMKMVDKIESVLNAVQLATERANQGTTKASQQATEELGNHVKEMTSLFRDMAKQSEESSVARQNELAEQSVALLKGLVSHMENQQNTMTQQMRAFVEQMNAISQNSQSESAHKMQSVLGDLGEKVGQMVATLAAQAKESTGTHNESLLKMTEKIELSLNAIQAATEHASQGAAKASQQVVEGLGVTTQEVVTNFRDIAKRSEESSVARQNELAEQSATLLKGLVSHMENQQNTMTQQMRAFVEQMNAISQNSQSESAHKMQSVLGDLGEKVGQMVATLAAQAKESTGTHNESLLKMTEKIELSLHAIRVVTEEASRGTAKESQQAIENLGNKMQEVVTLFRDVARQLEESSATRQNELAEQSARLLENLASQVDSLGRRVADAAESSKDAMTRMSMGAENLTLATMELSDAEKRVAVTMGAMGQVAQGLQSSAITLSGASAGVQEAFDGYKTSTSAFAGLLAEFKKTVELASKEAMLTTELVYSLKGAADKLVTAQKEADHYLENVTKVLGEAHEKFAVNIRETLRTGNTTFHDELSTAVRLLSGAIQDLGDVVDFDKIKRS